jgi:hypothetical protein
MIKFIMMTIKMMIMRPMMMIMIMMIIIIIMMTVIMMIMRVMMMIIPFDDPLMLIFLSTSLPSLLSHLFSQVTNPCQKYINGEKQRRLTRISLG